MDRRPWWLVEDGGRIIYASTSDEQLERPLGRSVVQWTHSFSGGGPMGNLGFTEILLIGVALLIFFGPSKLPQLGKALGEGIQEFKKASKELTSAASDLKK
jgi:sec-independent protein translocase protein TatA